MRATLRENGFKGPFQGLGATIVRNTPANAVYLGTFEVLKGEAAQRLGCKVRGGGGVSVGGGGGVSADVLVLHNGTDACTGVGCKVRGGSGRGVLPPPHHESVWGGGRGERWQWSDDVFALPIRMNACADDVEMWLQGAQGGAPGLQGEGGG